MFKKVVSTLTLLCFTITALTLPHTVTAGTDVTISPASGVYSDWSTFAAQDANFHSMPNLKGYGQGVYWPKDNFTKLSEMNFTRDASDPANAQFDWQMIDGQRWITHARENVGRAGVSSDEISKRIEMFPKTSSYVFAMYSPELAELVIEIQKIEKTPDGKLAVYRADYTPWHGEVHKWKRDYMTPAEKSDPTQLGNNPFESFKGAARTDRVFHNVEWSAVGVAVGHAMRYADAHIGYVASDKSRFTQRVKKSGGALKKKVKVYVDGYVKPQWFVATPMEVQPDGGMSYICVKNVGTANSAGSTSGCDAPEHVAASGVSIVEWSGGNMPEIEEKVYAYVYKKSSLTVIAFAIITAIVTWGLATALVTAMGPVAAGSFLGSISPGLAAAVGAGVYAGVAALQGGGITSAQASYAGETGNGVLKPNSSAWDEHQRGLNQGIRNKQITSRQGTGLEGVKGLYSGSCPEGRTVSECKGAGLDPGTMHRPDSYQEANVTLELRAAEKECKDAGLSGKALALCASPKSGEWTIDTGL